MKKLFALAAVAALVVPAFAGGDCKSLSSYRCENKCPLASKANALRSYGTEALATSTVARADVSKLVVGNLARI